MKKKFYNLRAWLSPSFISTQHDGSDEGLVHTFLMEN